MKASYSLYWTMREAGGLIPVYLVITDRSCKLLSCRPLRQVILVFSCKVCPRRWNHTWSRWERCVFMWDILGISTASYARVELGISPLLTMCILCLHFYQPSSWSPWKPSRADHLPLSSCHGRQNNPAKCSGERRVNYGCCETWKIPECGMWRVCLFYDR